jgi:hypothetical protein
MLDMGELGRRELGEIKEVGGINRTGLIVSDLTCSGNDVDEEPQNR